MALSASYYECNTSATSGNVNGGGFNANNANMLTDLAGTTSNGNSPVVTSASYNFAAGDVGHWLYIKAGTNWTPGWYNIASVAANAATLTATIGTAEQVSGGMIIANTVAGCATVASPTGGTFTIDYSRSTAAKVSDADFTAVGGSTTMTSATAAFTPVMVGNFYHQTTTGTGAFGVLGWYEIVSYTNATTVTTDRTTNNGTTSVACTGKIGGALSLGSSDDAVFELAVATASAFSSFFIKKGSYTIGGAISIAAVGNVNQFNVWEGYNTIRGDKPTIASGNQPTLVCGANSFKTTGNYYFLNNVTVTSTAASGINFTGIANMNQVKGKNTSTTAGRGAFVVTATNGTMTNCEGISYRGIAFNLAATNNLFGCSAHACDVGVSAASSPIIGNVVWDFVTSGISNGGSAAAALAIIGNTVYGSENKQGNGIDITASIAGGAVIRNNLVYGCTNGIASATASTSIQADYNNWSNNTNNVSNSANVQLGPHDTTVAPSFTNAVQRTGTTATTTAGSHLVQSGATFVTWGVTAGVDYVYLKSGTGITAGFYGIASVDSETQITLDIDPTANATADKTWQITQGRDFSVGAAAKAGGSPGAFPGTSTTSYLDQGAVQRLESGGVVAPRIFTGY